MTEIIVAIISMAVGAMGHFLWMKWRETRGK
jgi:hypothetical protein